MNTPKFKKGDWIKRKKDGRIARVVMLLKTCYDLRLTDGECWWLDYDYQDNWELTDSPRTETDLEKAARLYAIPHYMKDIDVNYIEEYPYDTGLEAAFIAGAKWQAEQDDRDVVFWKGMQYAYDQLKEEAIEGVAHPDDCEIWVNLVGYGYKFNDGDKVHIIVLPKED